MDRRQFLARLGGGTAALWLPPAIGHRRSLVVRTAPGARRGTGVPVVDPRGTTLEAAVVRADTPGYARLLDGPGWPTAVREELVAAQPGREDRRRPLAAIVHLTDIHLVDTQSPGRVEFLDPFGEPFTAAFRPQETLTLQVAASMVERINGLPGGPVTGRPFDCAVSTGDNIDNQQTNEARWFLNVLDGGRVAANSGDGGRYEGPQDELDDDPARWHPAEGQSDDWKAGGFPDVPGLLEAAIAPFDSPGLAIPWYSTYGNHDGLVQGNLPATASVAAVMTGRFKPVALPEGSTPLAFIGTVLGAEPGALEAGFGSGAIPAREVTPDEERRPISAREWVQAHLDSPASPGPAGHGYRQDHLELPALFYDFEIAPGVVGLSLDTGGFYSGSLGEDQVVWLEQQLVANSSRHRDAAGQDVTTANDDRVMIVFSHFNPRSMNSVLTNPERPNERRVQGEEVVALLQCFPNVVAWVNGHHHVNEIQPLVDGEGRGFWDINTASHIDHPQQARIVELVDNDDGTLSIFTTMVEHAAPAASDHDDHSVLGLASISRELGANDPQSDRSARLGRDLDRNVELVISAPFDLRAAGIGERPTTTSPPPPGSEVASPSLPTSADAEERDGSAWPWAAVGVTLAGAGAAGAMAVRRRREPAGDPTAPGEG